MELTTRTYTDADADAVARLHDAWSVALGGPGGFTAAQIRAWMTENRDFATDTRMLLGPDGEVVAFVAVGSPPPGGRMIRVGGGVHPRLIGRGLGRELLAWQVARASEIAAGGDGWSARANAAEADTATRALLARGGFEPRRYFFQMEAPTAGAVPAPHALPIVTTAEINSDILYAAHLESFVGHYAFEGVTRERWESYTTGFALYRPDLSFVALDDGEVAGYVLTYDDRAPGAAHVSAVGTRPAYRGRGVASALLTHVLAAAGAAGFHTVTLGTDAENAHGAAAIYARAGFVTRRTEIAYGRAL